MNSHTSRTPSFSAPVVQSRLEHHHQQQMLKQPETKRSKSLNNKGKRGFSYSYQQKIKETNTAIINSSSLTTETISRNSNSNKNYYNSNFDSSYHNREQQNVGCNNNNGLLVENGSVQRKSSPRPYQRRHQYSDSVDEDKFRVVPFVSILKRPQSATDFVKSSTKSFSSIDVTREEQFHYRSTKVVDNSPQRSQSKERRRSDVIHSRSRRVQRKEVKSMEFDTILSKNAISGDESDVNSNKYMKSVSSSHHHNNITPQSNNAVMFPPLNYSNAIIALEEGMNSNKKEEDIYSNSDDNIIVKSNKKRSDHYVETTPRRLSGSAIELETQISRFIDSDSESLFARRPGGNGPKLYAGPTFHNSPAPSDLPMPSFYSKSLGKEPSPLSIAGNNLFPVPELSPPSPVRDSYSSPSSGNSSDDDMFSMDDIETPTLRKQKSQELLRILSAANSRQHQNAAAYMVPERMATAHHPMHVYPTNDLNEISETLRSLLKIRGQ